MNVIYLHMTLCIPQWIDNIISYARYNLDGEKSEAYVIPWTEQFCWIWAQGNDITIGYHQYHGYDCVDIMDSTVDPTQKPTTAPRINTIDPTNKPSVSPVQLDLINITFDSVDFDMTDFQSTMNSVPENTQKPSVSLTVSCVVGVVLNTLISLL